MTDIPFIETSVYRIIEFGGRSGLAAALDGSDHRCARRRQDARPPGTR